MTRTKTRNDAEPHYTAERLEDLSTGPLPTFAIEDPKQQDKFGGHERLATALATAIRSDRPPRAIGILGPWGSGKSLVVRLLREKLDCKTEPTVASRAVDVDTAAPSFTVDATSAIDVKDSNDSKESDETDHSGPIVRDKHDGKNTYIYVYDAWLHQSDSPRRSFIEHFLRHVASGGTKLSQIWQDRLDRLTGRLDLTDTTETPVLSVIAAWVLLASCLIPVGTAALLRSEQLSTLWHLNAKAASNAILSIGLFIIGLPLLLVAFEIVRRWIRWKTLPATERGASSDAWLVALFVNKKAERTIKRIIKDPVPSTHEFQSLVRALTESIRSGSSLANEPPEPDPERACERLLVVIDNLDRLPDDEAKALWSTMRSLFVHLNPHQNSPRRVPKANLPQITVVVPLDEAAVARIYGDTNNSHLKADGFLEKTFDISVRVPRARMTDWEQYFRSKVEQCLGKCVLGDDLDALTHLVRTHLHSLEEPVTPRHLNALVNRIVAMWMQWQGELALLPVAYYALNQRAIDQDLVGHLSSSPVIGRLCEGWESALCAMHFGAATAKALEVALEAPLDALMRAQALSAQDLETMSTYSTIPGFAATFAAVLAKRPLRNGVEVGRDRSDLLNAACLLQAASPFADEAIVWKELRAAMNVSTVDRPITQSNIAGLEATLAAIGSPKLWVVQHFLDGIEPSGSDLAKVEGHVALFRRIAPLLAEELNQAPLRVPFTNQDFATLCSGLIQHPAVLSLIAGPDSPSTTLIIRDTVSTLSGTSNVLAKVAGMLSTAAHIDVDALVEHAEAGIAGAGYSDNRYNAFFLLAALIRCKGEESQRAKATLIRTVVGNLDSAMQGPGGSPLIAVMTSLFALPPVDIPELRGRRAAPINSHIALMLADCVCLLYGDEDPYAHMVAACQQQPWLNTTVFTMFDEYVKHSKTSVENLGRIMKNLAAHPELFASEMRERLVSTFEAHDGYLDAKAWIDDSTMTALAATRSRKDIKSST